jgi:hypothetical protein
LLDIREKARFLSWHLAPCGGFSTDHTSAIFWQDIFLQGILRNENGGMACGREQNIEFPTKASLVCN